MARTREQRALTIFGSAVLIHLAVGCELLQPPVGNPRLTDGGGGSFVTGLVKLSGGNFGGLTQDELQILSDEVRKAATVVTPDAPSLPELTNAQADAMLEFFTANGIASFEDLKRVLDAAAEDPESVVVPESLVEAFQGTDQDLDPNTLSDEDLESLFNELFDAAGVDPNA